ncbi:MAG: hypothetical protein IKF59_11755, partial [Lachnospiraceae bacterium]|nr:hypothetical protein [Lachnospiraceae bacterium]
HIRTPPRFGRLGGLALLCTHVWALANVRKTGYASISVFAAACSLFIHTSVHAGRSPALLAVGRAVPAQTMMNAFI